MPHLLRGVRKLRRSGLGGEGGATHLKRFSNGLSLDQREVDVPSEEGGGVVEDLVLQLHMGWVRRANLYRYVTSPLRHRYVAVTSPLGTMERDEWRRDGIR